MYLDLDTNNFWVLCSIRGPELLVTCYTPKASTQETQVFKISVYIKLIQEIKSSVIKKNVDFLEIKVNTKLSESNCFPFIM